MAQSTTITETATEPGALISFLSDRREVSVAEALAWESAAEAIRFAPLSQAA
ncbi:hypothetical protein [Nocardioides pakistanensis]